MQILHINSYYSGSNFYKNLYDRQVNEGIDIDVYVPIPKSIKLTTSNLGEYTTISRNHGRYDRFIFHYKQKKILKDIKQKYKINKYSLIHAHSLFTNGYIALKLKKKYGIPYIVSVRNTDVNYFFKYMIHLRKVGINIMSEAEAIIFLSETYRDAVLEKYVPKKLKVTFASKVKIIQNGIDDFWYKNKGTPKHYSKTNDLRLLYVGVVNKNKNLLTSIKAINILEEKGFDVKFTIVGKIENQSVYQEFKESENVVYVPSSSKESLIKIYRTHDIFVMPSITETFGLVYVEAMSQGLPVIYTKGQGFDGQFSEGVVGYHVDSYDHKGIAERVLDILSNYEYISQQSLTLSDNFNWGSISKKYKNVYGEISNE